jgi:hypothetical protein
MYTFLTAHGQTGQSAIHTTEPMVQGVHVCALPSKTAGAHTSSHAPWLQACWCYHTTGSQYLGTHPDSMCSGSTEKWRDSSTQPHCCLHTEHKAFNTAV